MQIVVNEQLKDAIEWTCKYADEYKVDIDIHIDVDGEVSVSICPTYRDRDTTDTPQTEKIKTPDYCDICNHKGCDNCIANNLDDYCVPSGYAPKDTPQTDCKTCKHNGESWCGEHCYNCYGKDGYEPQTDCGWGEPK